MKSGLLRKRSSGWFPRWQTRHVTHTLERLLTIKRQADSTRCRVFTVSNASCGKEETEFSVTCHDGRILCLRTFTKVDREDWIAALSATITSEPTNHAEANGQSASHARTPSGEVHDRTNGSSEHFHNGIPNPSKSTAVEPANSLISSGREFRIQTYEQGQFIGEFLKGLRHGMGRFEYKNGNLYTGAWQDDVKCGFGTLQWANKDVYTGEWRANKMWGYGQYQYAEGNLYTGSYVADNKHGPGEHDGDMLDRRMAFEYDKPGRFTWVIGDTYEGEWQDDRMHGEGVMRYKNGNIYSGMLQKNVKQGKGKMIWASGDSYEGDWVGDFMHGKGVFKYEGKGCYEELKKLMERFEKRSCCAGEWIKDRRHGNGKMTLPNGDVFIGLWKDEMRNGAGTCKYSNDDTYVGNFVNNLREGSGVYTAAPIRMLNASGEVQDLAGDQYSGNWEADQKHGYGRYVWTDGDVYEGEWQNDKRNHHGTCVYANGDKYTGEWLCDQRHGMGKLVWSDGNTYEGLWREDNIAPGAKSRSHTAFKPPSNISPMASQPSTRASSREMSAQGSPIQSPKPNTNASSTQAVYYVPNLQEDTNGPDDPANFDLVRAAGEIAGNWLDTLTGSRAVVQQSPVGGPANNLHIKQAGRSANAEGTGPGRNQLHMF